MTKKEAAAKRIEIRHQTRALVARIRSGWFKGDDEWPAWDQVRALDAARALVDMDQAKRGLLRA